MSSPFSQHEDQPLEQQAHNCGLTDDFCPKSRYVNLFIIETIETLLTKEK